MSKFGNRPGLKKNLIQAQKLRIFKLAQERFIDQDLIDAENKAKAAIEVALKNRCIEMASDIAILEKHGMITYRDRFWVEPRFIDAQEKTFELDSKTVKRLSHVERGAYLTKASSSSWHRDEPNWAELTSFYRPAEQRADRGIEIDLETPLPVITNGQQDAIYFQATPSFCVDRKSNEKLLTEVLKQIKKDPSSIVEMRRYEHPYAREFMCKEIRDAVYNFLVAHEARTKKEFELHQAIFAVINAAKKFPEIVDVWPEAVELIEDLFPANVEKAMSVVPADPNIKELLCSNMQSRGIVSPMMCETGAVA